MLKVMAGQNTVAPLRTGREAWGLFPEPVAVGQVVEMHVFSDAFLDAKRDRPFLTGEVIRCQVVRLKGQPSPTEYEADFRLAPA